MRQLLVVHIAVAALLVGGYAEGDAVTGLHALFSLFGTGLAKGDLGI